MFSKLYPFLTIHTFFGRSEANFTKLCSFSKNCPHFAQFGQFYSTKVIVGVRTKEILDKLAKTAKNGQNIQFFVTF